MMLKKIKVQKLLQKKKKIKDKYRKMRKRSIISEPWKKEETIESFVCPKQKVKRQVDKAAQIAAKNISKKYKNI